jgi:hypothetical protein
MKLLSIISLLVLLFFTSGCSQNKDTSDMNKKPISQIFEEQEANWLSIPGVQGFYEGTGENDQTVIVIMVDSLTDKIRESLPDSLEGYKVQIEETGVIKPLNDQESSTSPGE